MILAEEHYGLVDRVRLGLFKPIPGTPFQQRYDGAPSRFPGVSNFEWDYRYARANYEYDPARDRGLPASERRAT